MTEEKKKKKKREENDAAAEWLKSQGAAATAPSKKEVEDSALNEKDGVFTPKFGDYKRIFNIEKPKNKDHKWFHFRDAKNKYLGSVSAPSKEEALKHASKFNDAEHIIEHGDLIQKKEGPALTEVKKESVAPEVLKEEPKEAEVAKPKELNSKEQLVYIDGILHKKQGNSWVPHEFPEGEPEAEAPKEEPPKEEPKTTSKKPESVENILARNKPEPSPDSPEHVLESVYQGHRRLVHQIAQGLKNPDKDQKNLNRQARIHFDLSDEKIEEAGRKAVLHAYGKFNEEAGKNYHSYRKEGTREYDPAHAFHVFLKSQIEHHLIDASDKNREFSHAEKRAYTATKKELNGEDRRISASPLYEEDNSGVASKAPTPEAPKPTYKGPEIIHVQIPEPEEPKNEAPKTEAPKSTDIPPPKPKRAKIEF